MSQNSLSRSDLLAYLAQAINAVEHLHPLRVAIDGIDASGKTSLANELVAPLQSLDRTIIRASLDGFHNPRSIRYRRGPDSPLGYYMDAFDYTGLQSALLQPLGPGGNRCYRTAIFDYLTDKTLQIPWMTAGLQDILLFDGIFLLRPELATAWDFSIFIEVSFETALQRAIQRDLSLFDSPQTVLDRYQRRYLPAQQYYLQVNTPASRANMVIENNDPAHPVLVHSLSGME
jgi:uridine kinase